MGDNVLKFLRFFDWKKHILKTIGRLRSLPLLRLKIRINRHKPSNSPTILILKGSNEFQYTFGRGLCAYVEEDADLGVELAAEALEEP